MLRQRAFKWHMTWQIFITHTPGGGAAWGKSGVASSSKFACGQGGSKRQSCVEVCSLFCVSWGYQSVWKLCGKGIIFIDTFHTIRVLSNFVRQAGYSTFPSRRPPGSHLMRRLGFEDNLTSFYSSRLGVHACIIYIWCYGLQGFLMELTPRVTSCCIVRILEECVMLYSHQG